MKNKYLLISVLSVLALVSCRKGDDGMLCLSIEGMGGTKMAVEDNVSYWATGDCVNINGTTATIDISTSGATATTTVSVAEADAYFGVYPAGILGSNSGADYTLNLPDTYTYATTVLHGRTFHSLQAPMVGYSTGTSMQFKHVTAAINVQVINHYGFTIEVDSIVVASNKYKLNGSTVVTIGNTVTVSPEAAEGDANAGLRRVKMTGGSALRIVAGDTVTVQVPVLPVGNDNRFTVTVGVHKLDQSAVNKVFSKTQAGGSSDGYALGRAQVGYAPVAFGGLFSVGTASKVIISQGNLQYQASTDTWRFAPEQYTAIGNAVGNSNFTDTRSTQSDWIDLFGWGTSGHDHGNTYYMPYDCETGNSGEAYGYGPKTGSAYTAYNLTLDNNGDWGVNAISNGGNEAKYWYTISSAQIDTLLTIRTCSQVGSTADARYAKSKVNSVNGLIIFPDEYVHPDGVVSPTNPNIPGTGGFIGDNYDLSSWYKMEAAGAVFLPITGRIETKKIQSTQQGHYWTSTFYLKQAYNMNFASVAFNVNAKVNRYYGCAVRLVHAVE